MSTLAPACDYTPLVDAVRLGDSRALRDLAAALRKMLEATSARWRWALSREECEQVALFGLWRAAVTYDASHGRGFRSHAEERVRAELIRRGRRERRAIADLVFDSGEGDDVWIETFPARETPPDVELDARRILSRLAPEDALLLLAVASGESMTEAAAGMTREGAKRRHGAALRRAREAAVGMTPTPIKRRVQMLDRRFERLAGVLADGPLSISEVHRSLGAEVTPQAIGAWVRGLAAEGRLVTLRRGWQTVYGLPAKEAA